MTSVDDIGTIHARITKEIEWWKTCWPIHGRIRQMAWCDQGHFGFPYCSALKHTHTFWVVGQFAKDCIFLSGLVFTKINF